MIELTVKKEFDKNRLDSFLVKQGQKFSRSYIQKLIDDKKVLVNGDPQKNGYRLKINDKVTVDVPPPKKFEMIAEDIPLDIVYEDEDLLIVNKPRGMVTHPAVGNFKGTLVNALLHHIKKLSGIGGVMRPGIVHRLDKDTSGLLLVAKSDIAHQSLSKQLKDRTVKKIYVALVHGVIKQDEGYIQANIGRHPVDRKKMAVIKDPGLKSREALTFFKVIKRFKNFTLVELKLKTGRTHQIRVHMSHLGHPLVGDKTYGGKSQVDDRAVKMMLNAQMLGFIHPRTNEYMEFKVPMPEDMKELIQNIT